MLKIIKVVAAVIACGDRILAVQRGPGKYPYISYKFEFPGGKVEIGEGPEEALCREIQEELGMTITVNGFLMTVEHPYPDFELQMHCYHCTVPDTDLQLTEHVQALWCLPSELRDLDWAAADIPVVERLLSDVALNP
jgi:8-oxo-dGTP diphosphatase